MTPSNSRRARWLPQVLTDAGAWALALWTANGLRYDFSDGTLFSSGLLAAIASAVVLQLLFGTLGSLYRGRYRYGSFEEVLGVAVAVALTSTGLAGLNILVLQEQLLPRSVPLAGGVGALVAMVSVRYAWRLMRERRLRAVQSGEPLLLFGAGEGAVQTLNSILSDPASRYRPVGLVDDDPAKRNLRLRGIPVLGTRDDLVYLAARTQARALLVAIPSADTELVREINTLARNAGLTVKVLPTVTQLIDGTVGVDDIRDLDLADLLGRRQIDLDIGQITGYLTGKRVLVTGAGGSIGSELCRQIAQYAPTELIMLDRDESALHAVQLSLTGRALLDGDDLVLADIRDIEQVNRVFAQRRPEVVFHAAALKHLTLLERFPGEAVKSNVWGTLAVLKAAAANDVAQFVNISTDKAADPTSVLGYSKRIAERLTSAVSQEARGRYVSVRFGNVLGSRGSVLTAFTAQIASGGPVTVTHPDVTRYFMTVSEAVQLVIQAAAIGRGGDALVLDMGQPVRIAEVARRLVEKAAVDVEIVYTGLRPGEKLHEDLLGRDEQDLRPVHRLISQVQVPPVTAPQALSLDAWAPAEDVAAALRDMAAGLRNVVPSQATRHNATTTPSPLVDRTAL